MTQWKFKFTLNEHTVFIGTLHGYYHAKIIADLYFNKLTSSNGAQS